jgi:hypothetical protein
MPLAKQPELVAKSALFSWARIHMITKFTGSKSWYPDKKYRLGYSGAANYITSFCLTLWESIAKTAELIQLG